jgi:hypothetical protein
LTETVSACVIARDEEERLPDCLASLAFCEEIVLVDSGSRDRTREIAAAAGARVIENPWPGFAAQRNVALDDASGDWVLEIDADERVSAELATEIRAFLADPPPGVRMAALPMRDVFLGKGLGPAIRYPRYRHRLFRRGAFRHDESRSVHEGLWPDGPVAPLGGELEHLLAGTLREALRDTLAYARLEGGQGSRPGPFEALTGIFLRPVAKFAYRVLLYGAWRDGWRGLTRVWMECAADSLGTVQRLRHGAPGGAGGLGQQPPRIGSVRIVGLALSPKGATRIAPWLEKAAAAGADVALIGAAPAAGTSVRRRGLERATTGALVRALDAEDQLRPIDALLVPGWRERLRLKLAPGSLRGPVGPFGPDTDPEAVQREVRRQTRAERPT